ncbi:MAG: hypothetical protein IPO93_03445 [Actinobacteria bacterium]|nr:hypothetical protein [Actinomycetota bacterium]
MSAWQIHRVHRKSAEAGDKTITNVSTRTSVGIALGVGAGVIGLQAGERAIARGASALVSKVAPTYDAVSNPIGHVVALTILGAGMYTGYEYVVRRVEQGGAAVEPAKEASASAMVSGGPERRPVRHAVARGRRFVNMVLTPRGRSRRSWKRRRSAIRSGYSSDSTRPPRSRTAS